MSSTFEDQSFRDSLRELRVKDAVSWPEVYLLEQ